MLTAGAAHGPFYCIMDHLMAADSAEPIVPVPAVQMIGRLSRKAEGLRTGQAKFADDFIGKARLLKRLLPHPKVIRPFPNAKKILQMG